ncbi:MAG TPA: EAL domain-containing protein, partial [Streptosporangiaceae bacterium]|nr:EAL domain-containing protein [Streptosporangiaceae bacterium]
ALLLEINERVLTSEPAYAATAVEALAALGVALSLDDFGTGYSSLVRLKRLPVSEVKIDSSFISRLLHSADDEVIVQSIVDLVRALDIDSVAEGVESAEVATALRVMGCKAAQGWHFSRPLNPVSATAWLTEHGVAASVRAPLPSVHHAVTPSPAGPPPVSGPLPGMEPPSASVRTPGVPSLWWQAVNGFGPRLRGR